MFQEMRYRGPSLDELHDAYAKRHRIDEAAPIRSAHEVVIDAPAERVWALLADPSGWSAFNPAIRGVRIADDGAVRVDTRFTWVNGRTTIASRFAVVEPLGELTWTGSAMGSRAVHRHLITAREDGTTLLRTEESMAGTLLGLFYDSAKLHAELTRWLDSIKTAAERS
ncbi:SRPBCC family protein [Bailinhaonella thermotolerans]|uniref:Molecular chaperone Hsp90 n=1 Tax=Bailinhaonella thermotolerans TaxID=1070861 RepID=A0A3A4AR72_9ACTN|nr:SRPBCC family protein [Bailinhaonella thermotolerans]RJL30915.1 molecular chaperone Hsp90 [Bailinhaonella thermotolerans]